LRSPIRLAPTRSTSCSAAPLSSARPSCFASRFTNATSSRALRGASHSTRASPKARTQAVRRSIAVALTTSTAGAPLPSSFTRAGSASQIAFHEPRPPLGSRTHTSRRAAKTAACAARRECRRRCVAFERSG
jgi:hypothetical protein